MDISVVIPCFGDYERYLPDCLDSLKEQTFKDFEVIVDSTPSVGGARDSGARRAKGKKLFFLDVDDRLVPHALETFNSFDYDVVYSDLDKCQFLDFDPSLIWKSQFLPYCSLIKRELFDRAGGYKDLHFEDWEFYMRVMKLNPTGYHINEPLVIYNGGGRDNYQNAHRQEFEATLEKLHPEFRGMKTKIAFFCAYAGISGGARVTFEHANRLQKRGYQVSLVPVGTEFSQNWFPLEMPFTPLTELGRDIDIIICQGWQAEETALSIDFPPEVKIFHFCQGPDKMTFTFGDPRIESLAKIYREKRVRHLCISRYTQEHLKKEYGVDATLTPNGINTDMFYPDTPLEEKNGRRVLIVGDFWQWHKGIPESVTVLAWLKMKRALDVWWVCAIPFSGLGVADRVFLAPPQEQLRKIYSSCDITLKTSWFDGWGMPQMEAMACGSALLTTDCGGVRDFATDGETALFCRPADTVDIREKLERLLDDELLRERLSTNAAREMQRWDWEGQIDRLEAVLNAD